MPVTNAERADWAAQGLLGYAVGKEGGAELYDETELVLSDFLTDAMHFAEREGIDFITCVERAQGHYAEERHEEAELTTPENAAAQTGAALSAIHPFAAAWFTGLKRAGASPFGLIGALEQVYGLTAQVIVLDDLAEHWPSEAVPSEAQLLACMAAFRQAVGDGQADCSYEGLADWLDHYAPAER